VTIDPAPPAPSADGPGWSNPGNTANRRSQTPNASRPSRGSVEKKDVLSVARASLRKAMQNPPDEPIAANQPQNLPGGVPTTPRASPATPRAATPVVERPSPATPRSVGPSTPRAGPAWASPGGLNSTPQTPQYTQPSPLEEELVHRRSKEERRMTQSNLSGDGSSHHVGKSVFSDRAGVDGNKWRNWQRLIDNKTLGGHYSPVIRQLTADLTVDDPDQRDHDDLHACKLTKPRPEDTPHPRLNQTMPPQLTAFSDRAGRMREGRATRAMLMRTEPFATEWSGCKSGCTCPVCHPETRHPAGQPSHEVQIRKNPRCFRDHNNNRPPPLFWETEVGGIEHSMNSSHILAAMDHDQGPVQKPRDPQIEKDFAKCLGKKIAHDQANRLPSGMMPHRGHQDDSVPLAGTYDQDRYAFMPDTRNRGRQGWQGLAGDEPSRSGVHYILSPRPDDPPAPSKIAGIVRGEGMFKTGYSIDSMKQSIHRNQEMFRFADPYTPRGRSQPPPSTRDAKEYAGQPTGAPLHHMHMTGNPLTHEGKDNRLTTLSPNRATTAREFKTFRSNPGNESTAMSFLINHEAVNDSFAYEKAWRMENDDSFNKLCEHTTQEIVSARSRAQTNRGTNGHNTSDLLKSQLVWEE